MQTVSPISINVITILPKYTYTIAHTRTHISQTRLRVPAGPIFQSIDFVSTECYIGLFHGIPAFQNTPPRYKPGVVMMPTLSSLAAPQVVVTITCCATSTVGQRKKVTAVTPPPPPPPHTHTHTHTHPHTHTHTTPTPRGRGWIKRHK